MTGQTIGISNNDYWFKVVDMLQQNWALIESKGNDDLIINIINWTFDNKR